MTNPPREFPERDGAPNRAVSLPAISIVTPSFNRKDFLAETMESVLDQSYSKLEYVVVDGGSTDGSAELIKRRARDLAWWVTEPDGGACHPGDHLPRMARRRLL
jgi:GT2 family glycosyltransferase